MLDSHGFIASENFKASSPLLEHMILNALKLKTVVWIIDFEKKFFSRCEEISKKYSCPISFLTKEEIEFLSANTIATKEKYAEILYYAPRIEDVSLPYENAIANNFTHLMMIVYGDAKTLLDFSLTRKVLHSKKKLKSTYSLCLVETSEYTASLPYDNTERISYVLAKEYHSYL